MEEIQWRSIEDAPRDPDVELVTWGTMLGDHGYTSDEFTWTGIQWNPIRGEWEVTKPTGRYFCGFIPKYYAVITKPKGE